MGTPVHATCFEDEQVGLGAVWLQLAVCWLPWAVNKPISLSICSMLSCVLRPSAEVLELGAVCVDITQLLYVALVHVPLGEPVLLRACQHLAGCNSLLLAHLCFHICFTQVAS
jgi:hypothetical protein